MSLPAAPTQEPVPPSLTSGPAAPLELKTWHWLALGCGIFLLGFYLRVIEVNAGDLWYDEAFSVVTVSAPRDQMWDILRHDEVHPPLYYLLLRGWVSLFGLSQAAVRGFSLVFGLAILPTVLLIARRLPTSDRDRWAFGLPMMGFFAVSPFFTAYSVEARCYSMLAWLTLVSAYLYLRLITGPGRPAWIVAALAGSLAAIVATHYLSALVIVGCLVAHLLCRMIDRGQFFDAGRWARLSGGVLAGATAAIALWSAVGGEQWLEQKNMRFIVPADLGTLLRLAYVLPFGVDRQVMGMPGLNVFPFPLMPGNVGGLILVGAILVVAFAIQKLRGSAVELKKFIALLSIGLTPLLGVILASSFGLHVYVDRYVIGCGSVLLLACGWAGWVVLRRWVLLPVGAYLVLLPMLITPHPTRMYSSLHRLLASEEPSARQVAFEDPVQFVIAESYFGRGKVRLYAPVSIDYSAWPIIREADLIRPMDLRAGDLVVIDARAASQPLSGWTLRTTVDSLRVFRVDRR